MAVQRGTPEGGGTSGWHRCVGELGWRSGVARLHFVLSQYVFILAGSHFELSEPRDYFDIEFGGRVAQEAQELQKAHKLNKARRGGRLRKGLQPSKRELNGN